MKCDYCGKSVEGLPHKCKFCGKIHCYKHLQPENHECKRLPTHSWPIGITKPKPIKIEEEPISEPIGKPIHPKPQENQKKLKFSDRIKEYFLNKYEDLLSWLRRREHHPYDFQSRLNYVLTIILIFVVAVVGFSIFYSNAQKLNEINLWIIKLSGVLILASLFFVVKYGWKIIKELFNLFERQRNWLKYLVIIVILILLWQAYNHKTDVLNPVFDVYNKTNFSLFVPISFGNFSLNLTSSHSSNGKDTSFISDIGKAFKSEPERKDECTKTFEKLNNARINEGKKSINWDDRAYNLAVARSKDMYERNYFDHVTPEGKCVDDFKIQYGFGNYEFLAENAGGMSSYSKGDVAGNCDEALNGWLESRGHRYNLLYSTHVSGAIGCYYETCVFLGVNNDGFGAKPCTSGEEGLAFWQTVPKQPGEV